MDVFELLKGDHQTLEALLDQLDAAIAPYARTRTPTAVPDGLLVQLAGELSIHTDMEEQYFYPALQTDQRTSELASEAVLEHSDLRNMLPELIGMEQVDQRFMTQFAKLKSSLRQHVHFEENRLFLAAQEVLSPAQLADLADRMTEAKQLEESGEEPESMQPPGVHRSTVYNPVRPHQHGSAPSR